MPSETDVESTAAAPTHQPIALMQYWHDGNPPAEVRRRIRSWRTDPGFAHTMFDDSTATAFLLEHFDERTYRAYSSCDLPEMRADFFRLAWLLAHGGAYVDADVLALGGAAELFDSADRGMLFIRGATAGPVREGWLPGRITNNIMFVRKPGDPLIAAALEQAIVNIEGRVSNNIWEVTGPGIITSFWGPGGRESEERFRGFELVKFADGAAKVAQFEMLSYKDRPRYWANHAEPGFGSIFREPEPPRVVRRRLGGEFSMNMFKKVVELDQDLIDDPSLTQWLWADILHSKGQRKEMSFYDYVGKRHVRLYLKWIDFSAKKKRGVTPYPDWFRDRVERLAEISVERDIAALTALGLRLGGIDLPEIGLYNAQDYVLQRFYPMPDSKAPRTILDFGAGHGRQANLAFHSGDDVTETIISVDGIPGSYLTQRAYYAGLGLRLADYIEARSRGRDFDVSALAQTHDVVHLPTWRLDLVPDDSVDMAILVQVINELPRKLAVRAIKELGRVIKPGGALYIRDHLQRHRPNDMPIDQVLLASGFVLEFAPAVKDLVQIHGVPRIWRKFDPELYY